MLAGLRASGYTCTVEPCAGAMAMSVMAAEAGFAPEQMEASDVSLLSAVVGFYLAGRPLEDLGVAVDLQPYKAQGEDEAERAADILVKQLELRLEVKNSPHWNEYVRDVKERRAVHRERVARTLREQAEKIAGLAYEPMGIWEHCDRVSDDPKAIILAAPPSYKGGYERMYNTGGRMTWNEPGYSLFNPGDDHQTLAWRAERWKALLICVEPTRAGECTSAEPLSAYDMARGRAMYIWSNRPDECRAIMARPHAAMRVFSEPVRPSIPLLPLDHEFTEDSKFGIVKLSAGESRYVRDLWAHRIATGGDSNAGFGIVGDGYLCAVAGYMTTAQFSSKINLEDAIIVQGAMGAAHRQYRMNRLAIEAAISREAVNFALPVWQGSRVERAMTIVLTRHPESKVNRGIMKLARREPDPQHGYRLRYEAPIGEQTIQEVGLRWLDKERRRERQMASA